MNFKKALTPRDTEEIKPGLFIQTTTKGYRQVHPAVWNGEINYKNLFLGGNFGRNFIWFIILMFLAWSYFSDVNEYQEFYEEINLNPAGFCANISLINIDHDGSSTFTISNNNERPMG